MFGEEEKIMIRLLLGLLIKSSSFPFPKNKNKKYTAYTQGRAKTNYTITFDLLSPLANLLIRLCRGSDSTKANYTYLVALTASSSGCCDVNLGCWDKQLAPAFCLKVHSPGLSWWGSERCLWLVTKSPLGASQLPARAAAGQGGALLNC